MNTMIQTDAGLGGFWGDVWRSVKGSVPQSPGDVFREGTDLFKYPRGQTIDAQMIAYQGEVERQIPQIVQSELHRLSLGEGGAASIRRAIATIESLRDGFVSYALESVGTSRSRAGARDIQAVARRNIAALEFQMIQHTGNGVPTGELGAGTAGLALGAIILYGLTRARKKGS